ncbi:hypothetical protein [Brevundimonas sp.]|uniref:hypothetical protein n=1 Tax=Brevundimonas sp. TaxID=1871086 RepID=UPI002D4305E4|nr:hypothetical protein [Brevundimonas sp.]HYD29186.1 hypothetical protein [Brevundimonas sp.]
MSTATALLRTINTDVYDADDNPGGLDGPSGMEVNLVKGFGAMADAAEEAADAADEAVATAGASGFSWRCAFASATADADPGAGVVRLDAATASAATQLFADLADAAGADLTALLDSLDDSTNAVKGHLRLQHRTDATKWLLFTVSGVAAAVGYRKVAVAHVGGSAAMPFANADPLTVSFVRAGDVGATGSLSGGNLTGSLNDTAVTIASAATTDIGAAAGNAVRVTGTTTITALGTAQNGALRRVTFAGALTLTHNAASLILPGGANLTAAAGDVAWFESLGGGNWRCVDYLSAAAMPMLKTGGQFSGPVQGKAAVTLTDAATIAVDFSLGNSFKVTLGGNRTLGFPSNVTAEQAGTFYIYQDGTGSRTLAFASGYVTAGGLSTLVITSTAGACTAIDYVAETTGRVHLSARKDVKA